MRLMLIVPGFSAHADDWCIPALKNLVAELATSCDVRVLALRYPHRRGPYEMDDVRVLALGGADARRAAAAALLGRALAQLRRELRREPADVVHGFWADEPGALAVAAARLAGSAAVVSVMGGELVRLPAIGYGGARGRLNRLLTRSALPAADAVTVGSEYLAAMLPARLGIRSPRLLPLGVDTRRFTPGERVDADSPLTGGAVRLLHVGSLTPVKGQTLLLRAFRTVAAARPDVHLHIVGEGALRAELGALAETLGIAQRVTLHGAVDHERLCRYYRDADLFVQSSLHESQGLAVLEAAACGLAAVGTAVGVLPELDGARTVPAGDAGALADAVLQAVCDPDARAAAGAAALRDVHARFTLSQCADRLLQLYVQVADLRA